jgi:hypothetical protein
MARATVSDSDCMNRNTARALQRLEQVRAAERARRLRLLIVIDPEVQQARLRSAASPVTEENRR